MEKQIKNLDFYKIDNPQELKNPVIDNFLSTLKSTAGILAPNEGKPNAFVVGLHNISLDLNTPVDIVVGIGASIKNPSYCFGAYFISQLDAVDKLHKAGFVNVMGTIVLPTHFGSIINKIEIDSALSIQNRIKDFIMGFIECFYSHLLENIRILADNKTTSVQQIKISMEIVKLFHQDGNSFTIDQQLLETLETRSLKYGKDKDQGLLYAVSHPFYEQIISKTIGNTIIIKIGGKPEHQYLNVTNAVVTGINIGSDNVIKGYNINPYIFLTTKSGKAPLYYIKDGEPSILQGDYADQKFEREKDLQLIDTVLGKKNYDDFIQKFRTKQLS